MYVTTTYGHLLLAKEVIVLIIFPRVVVVLARAEPRTRATAVIGSSATVVIPEGVRVAAERVRVAASRSSDHRGLAAVRIDLVEVPSEGIATAVGGI